MAGGAVPWCIVACGLLLAAGLPAGAAPFLQSGSDAARTGYTTDVGPAAFDVAFLADLPGRLAGTPIVIGGAAYVATFATPWADDPAREKDTSAIWRIDLATAQPAVLAAIQPAGARVGGFASDGTLLFAGVGNGVRAFRLDDGREAWATPHPPAPFATGETVCRDPAVDDGVVYAACTAWEAPRAQTDSVVPRQSAPFVVALDAQTGDVRWSWRPRAAQASGIVLPGLEAPAEQHAWAGNLAAAAGAVYVTTLGAGQGEPVSDIREGQYPGQRGILWALDAATGAYRWHFSETSSFSGPTGRPYTPIAMPVAADGPYVYLSTGRLVVLDAADGTWYPHDYRAPSDDAGGFFGGEANVATPLTLGGNVLHLATSSHVREIELGLFRERWAAGRPQQGLTGILDERASILRAGELLFVKTGGSHSSAAADGNAPLVYAIRIEDGSIAWSGTPGGLPDVRVPVTYPRGYSDAGDPERVLVAPAIAVGDGVLVYASSDGHVRVFGRTAASIALAPAVADAYPALGAPAVIDVGATRPGALGPASEHRVVWGDSTTTDWTDATIFEHAYESAGEHVARVEARNDAGQTSSIEVLFHVGGTPPATPSLLATALAPSNAGLSFAVLGLFLGLLVAAVVLARRRREVAVVPLASEDRMEAYRAALEQAVDTEGALADHHAPVLAALRRRLGITDRDHALLLAAVRGQRRPTSALALTPGETVLGKYRILRPIGEGSQGQAFLAEDTLLDRQVVVKLLRAERGDEAVVLREARTMASIRHPHVVTIHDVDRLGDRVFIVMERMEGGSLADRLARGPLAPAELATLAQNLLGALGAVHAAGTLHLDVKPGNILLTADGQAKLADFGVAQRPGLDRTLAGRETGAGPVGTIQYMAPEQARGQMVTRRTDLYAAALVLYEARSGEPYHKARSGASPIELQIEIAAGRPFRGAVDAPEAVRAWFARALDPDPAQRFETAEAMLAEFSRASPSRGLEERA